MSTTYGQQDWDRPPHRRSASPAFSREIGLRFKNGANARGYEPHCANLSDRELMDIGTTRGEIDYVASTRYRPARHPIRRMNIRYLATVDGRDRTRRDAPMLGPTSAQGQKATLAGDWTRSALPPGTDITEHERHVR